MAQTHFGHATPLRFDLPEFIFRLNRRKRRKQRRGWSNRGIHWERMVAGGQLDRLGRAVPAKTSVMAARLRLMKDCRKFAC
jgi:hypothetical protein